MPSSPCSPSSDQVLQAYVVAGLGPLGCLFHQHGVEEADERGPGREDPDHLGPLANLLGRLPSNCWPRSAAMAATATRGRLSRPGSEPGPGALSRQEACPSARASSAAGLAEGARPEPYCARRTGWTARRAVRRVARVAWLGAGRSSASRRARDPPSRRVASRWPGSRQGPSCAALEPVRPLRPPGPLGGAWPKLVRTSVATHGWQHLGHPGQPQLMCARQGGLVASTRSAWAGHQHTHLDDLATLTHLPGQGVQ